MAALDRIAVLIASPSQPGWAIAFGVLRMGRNLFWPLRMEFSLFSVWAGFWSNGKREKLKTAKPILQKHKTSSKRKCEHE
jgi:hypothetical protein